MTRNIPESEDGWIDVSVSIYSGMVHWPGDPEINVSSALSMQRGDQCNVSSLSLGSHTGTHMDAPYHFVANGRQIDEMPLEVGIGNARVIGVGDPKSIKPAELEHHDIRAGERILFKTRNSSDAWQSDDFAADFVYVSVVAAEYLARLRVRLVGVDYLSVSGFKTDAAETHRALLEAGIWIVEGLNLSGVEPGNYDLCCLPLKFRHGDGAPARAALKHRL